jgi:thiol-disulfide isomerase/thioredoxin
VPDITLTNVYNYPVSKIRLSDLKGKLVILDFWATSCKSCIENFPKTQELQKEFINKLQIILVNTIGSDDIKKVRNFFRVRKEKTGLIITLPYSLQQGYLETFIAFNSIPHYVWVNEVGKIVAITSHIEITKENIRAALSGQTNFLPVKNDINDFNIEQENAKQSAGVIYSSRITGYRSDVSGDNGVIRDSDGKIIRLYAMNQEPIMLFKIAYGDRLNRPANQILIKSDSLKYFEKDISKSERIYTNTYCYDLNIPASSEEDVFKYMQEDLYRCFHLGITYEAINTPCLVLKPTAKLKGLRTKGGESTTDIDPASIKKFINNQPVSYLINVLNNNQAMRNNPVIDETNLDSNIDFELPREFYEMDMNSIIQMLSNYGFKVSVENRNINYSVISSKTLFGF